MVSHLCIELVALLDSLVTLDHLRHASDQGQTAAMTALAKRLLVGADAPFSPAEGLERLAAAVALGDPEAAAITATLAAAGAWRRQSWTDAFDLLSFAAERGSCVAGEQLRLLAGAADSAWRAMVSRIDLSGWLAAPPRTPICEAPRIRIAPDFIAPAICDWLVARNRNKVRPAKMVDSYGATPRFTADRTNSDYVIDIVNADVVLTLVRARLSGFINLPTVAFEPPQMLHYATGQALKPHFDFLRRGPSDAAADVEGDRILTALIYLNDNYEGGETDFPRAGVRHKGPKGGVIVFANVDPSGRPDPMTLHAGLAPSRGEKWLLSQWVRDRPIAAG